VFELRKENLRNSPFPLIFLSLRNPLLYPLWNVLAQTRECTGALTKTIRLKSGKPMANTLFLD
jgi:hypothetical protein